MAFQCNNGNDVCQGKLGRYKIRYTVPSPGRLEYQYPGESVQVILGDGLTYTTQIIPPRYYGGGCNKLYAVQYQDAVISNGEFVGWGQIYTGGFFVGNDGPLSDVRLYIGGVDYGILEHWWYRYSGVPPAFPNSTGRPYSVYAKNKFGQDQNFLNITTAQGLKVLGFIPIDGSSNEGCNPPSTCTFKVFQNSTEIFSRTDLACPTVNVFNCFMGDDKGEFAISNSNPAKTLDIVQSLSGNVRSSEVKLGGVTVKKLDSPAGCQLYPEVCYDCEEEEKCPPGTCECTRGNLVCCYDPTTGEVVKSFTKG